jgi:hypothetical protein
MMQRQSLARVDNDSRRRKIGIARDIIYQMNYAVNSKRVDDILKAESLAPTSVGMLHFNDLQQV